MVRKLRPHLWTANPLESYRHDELVTLILEAEYPGVCPWHDQPKLPGDHRCEQCVNPHKGDPYMDPALRHESTRNGRTVYSSHADGPYADRCANCPPACICSHPDVVPNPVCPVHGGPLPMDAG